MRYSFENDYSEGAHHSILAALERSNLVQTPGYGEDEYCLRAAEQIRRDADNPEADVHFIPGGTQTNLIALAGMLRPHESVISAESGHICTHEAGAVEATGHKVNAVPCALGKVIPAEIERVVAEHYFEHMVLPRAVYISQSSELGTVYTRAELQALRETCDRHALYLYADGARLGAGLTSSACDMDLPAFSRFFDAWYIGGTKNGALLGEALVINNPALKTHFRYLMKQRGGLMAKGRLLGIQFEELFREGLYWELARHANQAGQRLARGLRALGFEFLIESPTNQIFPILPDAWIPALMENFAFFTWARVDAGHQACRLVTSWSTPDCAVDDFLAAAAALKGA